MKYLGSKRRIAKDIVSLLKGLRGAGQTYVEPFIGGANIFGLMEGPKIGADLNPYLIALLKSIRDGWEPPEVLTERDYQSIKNNPDLYPKDLVGFAGFCCSYGARWFRGYRRDKEGKRDYIVEARNDCLKTRPGLEGAKLVTSAYWGLGIPQRSLIYCDPPYKMVGGYVGGFTHWVFFEWLRFLANNGHTVLLSEYEAPEDFHCIWSKRIGSPLAKRPDKKHVIEKLFLIPRGTI